MLDQSQVMLWFEVKHTTICRENRIDDLEPTIAYHLVEEKRKWKAYVIQELIEVRTEAFEVWGIDTEEIQSILEHLFCFFKNLVYEH